MGVCDCVCMFVVIVHVHMLGLRVLVTKYTVYMSRGLWEEGDYCCNMLPQ